LVRVEAAGGHRRTSDLSAIHSGLPGPPAFNLKLFRLFPFAHLQHISSEISPIGCNRQTLVRPRRVASAPNVSSPAPGRFGPELLRSPVFAENLQALRNKQIT
jgi:hypothetical protein